MKSFVLGTLGVISLSWPAAASATAEETYKSACGTCHDAGGGGPGYKRTRQDKSRKGAGAPRAKGQVGTEMGQIPRRPTPSPRRTPSSVKAVVDLMIEPKRLGKIWPPAGLGGALLLRWLAAQRAN